MATYQQKIENFLTEASNNPVEIAPELLKEFSSACTDAVLKQFQYKRSNTFSLRMSNIGHNLRQLHLQKLYGRANLGPDTKMRMLWGDISEALWILIIKASGIEVVAQQKHVTLTVDGVPIPGTLDLVVLNEDTGEEEVIDIKSTSYIRKFTDIMSVAEDDSFGYLPQLFGYAQAEKKRAGGLWVFDKVGGSFRIVEVVQEVYNDLKSRAMAKIFETVEHFTQNKPIPECPGFEIETFYGKPTGNYVLNDACKFCDYKDKCHPGISPEPCRMSKAKDKPMKWYKSSENSIS